MYASIRARRRSALTNYKRRIALLKSRMNRVVVRRSNSGIYMQIVEFTPTGDKVLVSVSSAELSAYGWQPRRNIPTAYLTGALLAKKADAKKINAKLVLDTGLYMPIKNSVVFAAAKGAADAGLGIVNNIEFDAKRLSGSHIAEYAKALRAKGVQQTNQFSQYAKAGFNAESIEELFNTVKQQISKR